MTKQPLEKSLVDLVKAIRADPELYKEFKTRIQTKVLQAPKSTIKELDKEFDQLLNPFDAHCTPPEPLSSLTIKYKVQWNGSLGDYDIIQQRILPNPKATEKEKALIKFFTNLSHEDYLSYLNNLAYFNHSTPNLLAKSPEVIEHKKKDKVFVDKVHKTDKKYNSSLSRQYEL